MDEQMIETAKVVMADTFKFYIRAHGYHWNVEGPDFYQYHKLLEEIYEVQWTQLQNKFVQWAVMCPVV